MFFIFWVIVLWFPRSSPPPNFLFLNLFWCKDACDTESGNTDLRPNTIFLSFCVSVGHNYDMALASSSSGDFNSCLVICQYKPPKTHIANENTNIRYKKHTKACKKHTTSIQKACTHSTQRMHKHIKIIQKTTNKTYKNHKRNIQNQ